MNFEIDLFEQDFGQPDWNQSHPHMALDTAAEEKLFQASKSRIALAENRIDVISKIDHRIQNMIFVTFVCFMIRATTTA